MQKSRFGTPESDVRQKKSTGVLSPRFIERSSPSASTSKGFLIVDNQACILCPQYSRRMSVFLNYRTRHGRFNALDLLQPLLFGSGYDNAEVIVISQGGADMEEAFKVDEVAQFENATWSRCAKGYMEGFNSLVAEAIDPLLEEVNLNAGERVLDVGTGPGLVAARAVERGASVVGVDISDAMLDEARQLLPGIDFHQGSAENLPFEDEQFDVVVGNFVLHHLNEPGKALEEAYRVLRVGGRIGLTVWADPSKLEAFGLYFAAVEEHLGAVEFPHGPLYGVSDFAVFHAMAGEVGFHDSSVRELEIAWRTGSIESYLSAFGDWANLEAIAPDAQRAIEATVRERARIYRDGDVFSIPNPAILVSAIK